MSKNKFKRFCENKTFENLFQPAFKEIFNSDYELKGKWHSSVFCNQNPIILELGCGKGEYAVALAELYPEKNFIGIDIKGARIWRGAKTGIEKNLKNLIFIRSKIECITSLFAMGEISEIWLTFPDPQPKKPRKRLTSPLFLDRYTKILNSVGLIHLKTDSQMLHHYTKALIAENRMPQYCSIEDIYMEVGENEILKIQTTYEKIFLQRNKHITYLQFGLAGKEKFQHLQNFDESIFERYNTKKEK